MITKNILRLSDRRRAWVEIGLDALSHNINVIRGALAPGCELMAVIKADAYGHGAIRVSKQLMQDGVDKFAVATISEALRLRESGLVGELLVLGYTQYEDAVLLNKYDLTGLVADGAHAEMLDAAGHKLRIHVAIDTGMHRLGICPSDFSEIESIYKCKNLEICGFSTHLAASDSLDKCDIEFTRLQTTRMLSTMRALQENGYDIGKVHIQASFGVFNYPDIPCDYARVGVALFGGMDSHIETIIDPNLRPVLSVRARVAQVRWIDVGESVSYGRTYTASKLTKLATVSIGYADGVPRQLSGNGGMCILHGVKVPIVGIVCMDMLMIDVTSIENVHAGDIVTLIGKDGIEEVRCEDVAGASGTITYEILCRLGNRLPRVYI